jgi:hypothetical protein
VAPQVEFGPSQIIGVLACIGDGFRFAVVFRATALAQLVALASWDVALDALALVCLVVAAAVGATADDLTIFDYNTAGWHNLIEGLLLGYFTGGLHELIAGINIANFTAFRQIRIDDRFVGHVVVVSSLLVILKWFAV